MLKIQTSGKSTVRVIEQQDGLEDELPPERQLALDLRRLGPQDAQVEEPARDGGRGRSGHRSVSVESSRGQSA